MPRPALRVALVALAAALLGAACGGLEAQNRPEAIAFYPANGAVVPGWLAYIRVTYDEPVRILNDSAARVAADAVEDGGVAVRIYPDPEDPTSILIAPTWGGHFWPGQLHHVVVQEGAVVNADDHYALDEFDAYFTIGLPPSAFATGADGRVYEFVLQTGALVSVTQPPAGHRARLPVASAARVWVWLDPVAPGPSQLGVLAPGDPVASVVPLAGEVGPRRGSGLVGSLDGRWMYAVAEDPGAGRLLVHRINVALSAEVGPPLVLSAPLAGAPASFQAALDPERNRLVVPSSDGAGGGWVSFVDLTTFTEIDAGPAPGVGALPLPEGSGPCSISDQSDRAYVVLSDEASAGFALVDLDGFEIDSAREPTFPGQPAAGVPTPEQNWFVQGLSGYPSGLGLVKSRAYDLGEGFADAVPDDGGAGPIGATNVSAFLLDPATEWLWVFADNGAATVMSAWDVIDADVWAVDLDLLLPGTQGIALAPGIPTAVTGVTVLRGFTP